MAEDSEGFWLKLAKLIVELMKAEKVVVVLSLFLTGATVWFGLYIKPEIFRLDDKSIQPYAIIFAAITIDYS
jgi:hypothetical protein